MLTPSELDQKVIELEGKIKVRRSELEKDKKKISTWKTSCVYLNEGIKRNLQVESNLENLIDWYSNVSDKIAARSSACHALDIDDCPLEFNGYPLVDWLHDISNRIKTLQLKEQEDKIKKMEAALDGLRSEQQKRIAGLEALEEELGN